MNSYANTAMEFLRAHNESQNGTVASEEMERALLAMNLDEGFTTEEVSEYYDDVLQDFKVLEEEHQTHLRVRSVNGEHYIWCCWSKDSCVCGPDTCGCHKRPSNLPQIQHAMREARENTKQIISGMKQLQHRNVLRMLTYLDQIHRVAQQARYGEMADSEVADMITMSANFSDQMHACIFGYMQGKPENCGWCPKGRFTRVRLCEKARFVRSVLRQYSEFTQDKEDWHSKKRGAKKFDKIRYIWKNKPRTTHDPYWDTDKFAKRALATPSARAQNLMKRLKRTKVQKMADVPHQVTLEEAMQCRYMFEPKKSEKKTAVFGPHHYTSYDLYGKAKKFLEAVKRKGTWKDIKNLQKEYVVQRDVHHRQDHHVESKATHWEATFEMLLGMLAWDTANEGDVLIAYERMWHKMIDVVGSCVYVKAEYQHLNVIGVLTFLNIVQKHGLYNLDAEDWYKHRRDYTYITQTYMKEEFDRARVAFQTGNWPNVHEAHEIAWGYARDMSIQIQLVRNEMARLCLASEYDFDKSKPHMFIAYCWERANGWRDKKTSIVIDGAQETMMSVAANAVEAGVSQAVRNPETQDGLATTIQKAFQPYLNRIMDTVNRLDQHADRISDSSTTTLESVTGLTAKLEDIVCGAGAGLGTLFDKVGGVADGFTQVAEIVKTFIGRIGSFMPETTTGRSWMDLPAQWWDMIDAVDVLELVKLYILYIHCDSKVIRGIIVMLALRRLGLLQKVVVAIKWLYQEINSYFCQETNDETTAQTTWFDMLADMFDKLDVKKASFISGLVVCLFCGVKVPTATLAQMGKKIMGMLTTMHFVGLGLLGGKRIFEYIQATFIVCFDYMKEQIFNIKCESKQNVTEVAKWAARVKYFVTEEGVRMIRTSSTALKEAEQLYPQGVELYIRTQGDRNWAGLDMTRLVQMLQKDALVVHNVVYRVKNYTSFRPTMFHIQLVGSPGIGKSTLTSTMVTDLKSRLFTTAPDTNLVYSMGDTDHYDGYAQQLFVIGDDLWKYQDAKHATAIIGLITNTPVLLPMAHLEDKGTYLDSEIMISSVNNPYPWFRDVLCQDALRRRRHVLVNVDIDPDVMDAATHKYDDALWRKKYKEEQRKEFPHLKFSLLKPICDVQDPHEFEFKDGTPNLPAMVGEGVYRAGDNLPKGLKFPLKDLTYAEFMERTESRYRAMREEEKKALPVQRKALMERNWQDIDHAIDVFYNGNAPSRFLQGLFLPVEVNMGQTRVQRQLAEEVQAQPDGVVAQVLNQVYETQVRPQLEQAIAEEAPSEEKTWDEMTEEQHEKNIEMKIDGAQETSDDVPEARTVRIKERRADDEESTTSTFMTAQEMDDMELADWEAERRARILAQRQRHDPADFVFEQEDNTPPYEGLILHEGKWYMMLSTHYEVETTRYNCKLSEGSKAHIRERNGGHGLTGWWRQQYQRKQFYEQLGDSGIRDMQMSAKVRVPATEPFSQVSADSAGKLKIEFLRRLKLINSEWYYDLSHLERAIHNSHQVWNTMPEADRDMMQEMMNDMGVHKESVLFWKDNQRYDFITLGNLVLADTEMYDYMMVFLEELNLEQQKFLVEKVRTVYDAMGQKFWNSIKSVSIRTWLNQTFRKMKRFGMWFWDTFCAGQRWQWTLMGATMVVVIAMSVGEIFTPPRAVETSKVLFRGRGMRPIIGNHTAADLETPFQQQAESLIRRNLARFSINGVGFAGVKSGQYIYTVWHALRKAVTAGVSFMLDYQPTSVNDQFWAVELEAKNVYHVPESDFCVIYSPNIPAARNIDSWFMTNLELQKLTEHEIAHCYFDSSGYAQMVMRTPNTLEPRAHVLTEKGEEYFYNWMVKINGTSMPGSSGGPVMTTSPYVCGRRIFGLQSLNRLPWSFAQGVTQEMIQQAKNSLEYERRPISEHGPLICEETCKPLNEKYITEHLDIAGYVPKEMRAGAYGDTKFVKTPLGYVFNSNRVPAILQRNHKLVPPGTHPLQHSINKFGRDVMGVLPEKLLQRAVRDVAHYVSSKIGNTKLRELTMSEIVLGHDHEGSGSMNLATSPGLPYVKQQNGMKGKTRWLQIDEQGDIARFDRELQEELLECDDMFRHGEIPPMSMYEFAKDELRPIAKAYGIGGPIKTRSITVMNMIHAMLFRKYHLDLTAHMHEAADGTFQSCVGINPEGPEWMSMFACLFGKSQNNCFDLDVGNWDGHFTAQLWFAVVKCINLIYGDDEFSASATARYAIAHAAIFGYDQFDDVVYKKCRGMPSGYGGTAIVNTLGHMILFYVLWLKLAEQNKHFGMMNWHAYIAFVCVRFYGDDVVASVHDDVKEWFNAETVAQLYTEYGWPTTSAAKDGAIKPFVNIMDVQFLKRKFVLDEEFGLNCVHGQIDEDVIVDLFVWMRRNSHTVDKQQMLENVHNAFQFAFAYGKDKYQQLFEKVNKALTKYGYEEYYIDYEIMRDCMLRERFGLCEG